MYGLLRKLTRMLLVMKVSTSNSQLISDNAQQKAQALSEEELRRVVGFFELLTKIDKRHNVTKGYRSEQDKRNRDNSYKAT